MKKKIFSIAFHCLMAPVSSAQDLAEGSAFFNTNKNGICDNYENRKSNSKTTSENNNCKG